MPEEICEKCHGAIKKGEKCSETDYGSGKFIHWPTCPSRSPESHSPEKPTEQMPSRIKQEVQEAKNYLDDIVTYGVKPRSTHIAQKHFGDFMYSLGELDTLGVNKDQLNEAGHWSVELGTLIIDQNWEGIQKYIVNFKHLPLFSDPSGDPPPEMTFIVDGLTLKDYYDLRDLRLLLMGLEKELIGKYGIIEAEPLSSKVRDLIKEKITEINNKIEASPSLEHHSISEEDLGKVKAWLISALGYSEAKANETIEILRRYGKYIPEHHSNGDPDPISPSEIPTLSDFTNWLKKRNTTFEQFQALPNPVKSLVYELYKHTMGDDPPLSTGTYVVRFNEGTSKQEDIEIEASSPEAATIEAARKYNEEHSEYPKTARILPLV